VGFEVHALHLDFAKAFAIINHSILLQKLAAYGVSYSLLTWFTSYLSGRSRQVKVGGCPPYITGYSSGDNFRVIVVFTFSK
jgi:hypothetical protein